MDVKAPTLAAFNETVVQEQRGESTTPEYSENLVSAVEKTKPNMMAIERDFRTLGTQAPEQRAMVGGKMGAVVGGGMKGLIGSLIGAGVGAFAGRAIGALQSGEQEASTRFNDSLTSLMDAKVINKKGQFVFPNDEGSFDINLDPSYRLPNLSAVTTGKADRKITESDPSSPFHNRAGSIAKALSYYQTWGVQKWDKSDNPKDVQSIREMTGLLSNAITDGSKSMDNVRNRAMHITKKYGLDEKAMRTFFAGVKNKIPDEDALEIKKGMDLLFKGR